jgi:hypothetical protein
MPQEVASTTDKSARVVTRPCFDKILNVTIVLVALLGVIACTLPVFGHRLYVGRGTLNFGVVRAGQAVKQQFLARNLHPWPIEVTGIGSDCGCTETSINRTLPFQLAPFEAVMVNVTIDTRGKRGKIQQVFSVQTRDNARGTAFILEGIIQ